MGDHHHRTGVGVDRIDQSLGAGHVEVIGRFVEEQHVGGPRQHPAQQGPRFFSSGEDLYLLQGQITAEHHGTTDVPDLGAIEHGVGAVDLVLDGALVLEHSHGALAKQAHLRRGVRAYLPVDGFQFPCQQPQQRRLALTVGADHPHPVTGSDVQFHPIDEDRPIGVCELELACFGGPLAGVRSVIEGEGE